MCNCNKYRKALRTIYAMYDNPILQEICIEALSNDGESKECDKCSTFLKEAREEIPMLQKVAKANLSKDRKQLQRQEQERKEKELHDAIVEDQIFAPSIPTQLLE